ncbi:hypothetical protein ES708_06660 [subsurface metagenome]
MYIKVVTVKVKVKGQRAKKVYRYVRVVDRGYVFEKRRYQEKVIATLGTLGAVRSSANVLARGLTHLPGQ